MRSRSVNLINLISNQCDLLTVMQDKKDLSKYFNKQKFRVADPVNPKNLLNPVNPVNPVNPTDSKDSKDSLDSLDSKNALLALVITNHTYKLCLYVRVQVSNHQRRATKTSYLFLLLAKIVAFTKNYKLKANKRINKIPLRTRENKYLSPLNKPWERDQRFLTKLQGNRIRNFCKNSNKNHKNLLITFSGGQDSITLLVLLFGIQSQNLLKLNALWNHHLWHKDSFFITRHILKLSFLFKISTHSAIATRSVKTEIQARQWRLKVSRRLSNFYKYQNVMQAHSGTDKIETLLLNLFRGTGNTSPFHSTDFSLNFSQTQKRKLIFP